MATTLGTNVLDKLLKTIDNLRSKLHAQYGTRPYRVYSVVRTYNDNNRQDGYFTEVSTELTPPPQVDFVSDKFEMLGSGKNSNDKILVSRISLTFSKDQLLPSGLLRNQKHYILLVDNHGENMPNRYFHITGMPTMDRDKTLGWYMYCQEIQDKSWSLNGVQ